MNKDQVYILRYKDSYEDIESETIPDNFTGQIFLYFSIVKFNTYHMKNGLLHREEGPAIQFYYGQGEWYWEGVKYSQSEWFELLTSEQKEIAVWNLGE